MTTLLNQVSPVRVFCSYSHKDERYKDALEEHLAIFERTGLISLWSDRAIRPGKIWNEQIIGSLLSAQVILLLISPSFIASHFCHEVELMVAMDQYRAGLAEVIPIIVRPVLWKGAAFEKLQCLPKDALSVAEWGDEDCAWRHIAVSLRPILEQATCR